MTEITPSREAATQAARDALAEMKASGWETNPAYWVGRLEAALTGVLRSAGPALPDNGEHATGGCGAVDADDFDACGKCSDCAKEEA
ncbi:hypothetical protein IHE56_00610 [Streptomyces sp. ID01-12c]|nr:hypothetical protein [Streptomyces caniscabiei]